jgi:hypothetical protein
MTKRLGVVLATVWLFATATAAMADDQTESNWVRRDRSELIQKFGGAQYVLSDGHEGAIMAYLPMESMKSGSPIVNAPSVNVDLIKAKASAFRLFFIDKNDRIYRVESKGSAFKWDPPWWW